MKFRQLLTFNHNTFRVAYVLDNADLRSLKTALAGEKFGGLLASDVVKKDDAPCSADVANGQVLLGRNSTIVVLII